MTEVSEVKKKVTINPDIKEFKQKKPAKVDSENENSSDQLKTSSDDEEKLSDEVFHISPDLLRDRAADVTSQIARDIHLRQVNYKTHEFIKLSEVSQLVTDCLAQVVDKMNARDKQITTLKQLVRKIDSKQKNQDMQLNSLLKLQK